MNSIHIIVSANPSALASVTTQLKKHGMKIDSVLDATGTVLGQIEADKLTALKSIPGISIEQEESVQIPAPDSPIQ